MTYSGVSYAGAAYAGAGPALLVRTADDALAEATEVATRTIIFARTATDTAPVTDDSAVQNATRSRAATDDAPAEDDLQHDLGGVRSVGDAAPALDAAARSFTGSRETSDDAPTLDSVVSSTQHYRTAGDQVDAPLDNPTRYQSLVRVAPDTAGATDDGTRWPIVFARSGADTLPEPSESVSQSGSLFWREVAEEISVPEDTPTVYSNLGRLGDSEAPADDQTGRVIFLFRTQTDEAPADDETTHQTSLFRVVEEQVSVPGDLPSSQSLLYRISGDLSGASDSPASRALLLRVVADGAPSDDEVAHLARHIRGLVENAPALDDLTHQTFLFRYSPDDAPADDDTSSRALLYREVEDEVTGVTDSSVRWGFFDRGGEDELPLPEDSTDRFSTLFRRSGSDLSDTFTDWAYARVAIDYLLVPRITILSVTHDKVSLVPGHDTTTIEFYFDLPAIAWTVRLDAESHVGGTEIGGWRSYPPTQYGALTIPAALLRRGTNTLTVYAQSLEGVWTR